MKKTTSLMTGNKMEPMLFDTHAHLQLEDYDRDRDELIRDCVKKGVAGIVNVGIDVKTSLESIDLAKAYGGYIYAAAGIHPNNTADLDDEVLNEIRTMVVENKDFVKAYGEIGLDYYREYSPPEIQKKWFKKQIRLARDLSLPIIIHSRKSFSDTFSILKEHLPKRYPVLFHCFSEKEKELEKLVEMEFMIAVGGAVTFKNSHLPRIVPGVPDHLLVVETDCPFLAPTPFRGKRNDPGKLSHIVQKIAEIKGISYDKVANLTTSNGKRFFHLREEDQLSYELGDNLYINLTNRCTCKCYFCPNPERKFNIGPYDLKLKREPDAKEVIAGIDSGKRYEEVVFCGFGEPVLRIEVLKEVAAWLKKKGYLVRLNTNGHGNMIYKRNILKELVGLIDAISISLNAENELTYDRVCRPGMGKQAYGNVLAFIEEAKKNGFETTASVVAVPEVDTVACEKIAKKLQVPLKIRTYQEKGL